MSFEPGLFIADAKGTLVARLDSIYDTRSSRPRWTWPRRRRDAGQLKLCRTRRCGWRWGC